MSEITINLEDTSPLEFFGVNNSKLNILIRAFPKLIVNSRGHKLRVKGSEEDIREFESKIRSITSMIEKYGRISEHQIEKLLGELSQDQPLELQPGHEDVILYGRNGLVVKARTPNQRRIVDLSATNDIIFAIGPAGTGKTYTAVALAVRALKNKQVRKIVLTRPAVEAGESLGFLPGDLKEKVDPYLRPLYDALDDMVPIDRLNYLMQNRIIEIAPLAFMRGRTLDNAFIILDEAQNTTDSQIKMFLTRLGPSAKCIVTGDLTQIDLPKSLRSGLPRAIKILEGIDGIATVTLTGQDVIRHKLVKRIIHAYKVSDEVLEAQKQEKERGEAEKENPANRNND